MIEAIGKIILEPNSQQYQSARCVFCQPPTSFRKQIPSDGIYRMDAYGARGGGSNGDGDVRDSSYGGSGAHAWGYFSLKKVRSGGLRRGGPSSWAAPGL
jgi:hypothetical protein